MDDSSPVSALGSAPEAGPARPARDRKSESGARSWRRGIRVFSSASDAPRSRRPTDVILLAGAFLMIVVLSLPAPGPTTWDELITHLVQDLPGLFGWFWEIAYDVLLAWAVVLLAFALFSHDRWRLLIGEVLAAALALGLGLLAGSIAGTDWSDSFKAVSSSRGPAIYLAVRLALATAIVVMASPYMSRPFRQAGRWVVGFGAVAGVALGVTFPIGMVAGFAVGIAAAAAVHLVFGSPAGRLTLDQVASALVDLDVEATGLRHGALQPRGAAAVTAHDPEGRSLLVKVYGRDAWDGQLLAKAWNSLWYRGDSAHLALGRREQVEHEAFITLLAERGGVSVLPVVAAGMASENDALLVTEVTGRPLAALGADEVDGGLLEHIWDNAARLHDLSIGHGLLDDSLIVIRPDGSPAFGNFSQAEVSASEDELVSDDARILVATALSVGVDRAAAAALAALRPEGLQRVLPVLQPAAFDRQVRHAIGDGEWTLDDLRKACATAADVEVPKLAQIRRVSLQTIVIAGLIALIAFAVVSSVANVGLDNLIDEFASADFVWLAIALGFSIVVPVALAFGTLGASFRPIRFLPVLMLEYAIQFIALAIPSSAARFALDVRFFGRNGVEAGGAISIGAIDGFCGFVTQVVLILVISLSGLASLHLGDGTSSSSGGASSSGGHHLLVLAVVLVVLGVLVTLAVPKYRRAVAQAIPRYRAMLHSQMSSAATALRVLRSPSHLAMIFGGNLAAQLLQAIILGLCLRAFGHQATLAELLLVNTLSSLFAGFMPVPGGMGVAETAYTFGLVAIGVPNSAAMSTAIAFRAVTFYLPPIWGAMAMRWLRRHSFV